jgi:hypothetical protein
MKRVIVIRLSVASLFGALSAVFVGHDYEKWRALGREAFLAEQAHRFDTHMASPSWSSGFAAGLGGLMIIGIYEGIVALGVKLTSGAEAP